MSSNEISDREGIILNFIEKMGPLAWRKYQQRYPHVWVKDHSEIEDRTSFPPYISFRFQKEKAEVIATLKNLISTYEGEAVGAGTAFSREFAWNELVDRTRRCHRDEISFGK